MAHLLPSRNSACYRKHFELGSFGAHGGAQVMTLVVEIVYNGVTKPLQVEPEEQVTALLQKAIAVFGITQNPHLLSLFRQDGSVVPENESVERAGLKPGEVLLLRPNVVKGGGEPLRVAGDILPATFSKLRDCGRGQC